ncbi:unnamed protein product [Microthlaspi erraticum]|uniref:Uncharacterized protein n=1 Tax=Microthlaspi erraticum TaxID=1685480 RepID=A0A6D2JE22_9BRAS|nr:unnamed protein product [Microthlaspi erraticum]
MEVMEIAGKDPLRAPISLALEMRSKGLDGLVWAMILWPPRCMRTRSSRSTEDLVELDLQRVERGFRGHRGYKRNLRCLLLIQWMYQRGMETLWAMDSVELGKLDRLVKEMLQTATNRDKGLFHHQCRTTTLRSSWE